MGTPDIPPQQSYFYNGVFNAEMDATLLTTLVQLKSKNNRGGNEVTDEDLQIARLSVIHHHQTHVSWPDIVQRKHELFERYTTYRAVANFKGVVPDWANSRVHADEKTWSRLFHKWPLAKAYRYRAEPEFRNLCLVFGFEDIKEEDAKVIISLSSTHEGDSLAELPFPIAKDDEEVTSPGFKTTRRKLFDDAEESASNVPPRGRLRTRGVPRRPLATASNTGTTDARSSCASSSPNIYYSSHEK